MAASSIYEQCFIAAADKDEAENGDRVEETNIKFNEMVTTLPKADGWITKRVVKYMGFWFTPMVLKGVMLVQNHFMALPTDILFASLPKSGTTWCKALIFSIINRHRFDFSTHPLLTKGPHDCIPSLVALFLQNPHHISNQSLSSPSLFATHIPYSLLPLSITSSTCKIVYIIRNPKDVLVSSFFHMKKTRLKELPPLSLEKGFEMFCQGVYYCGPYWDHVLGYWNASRDSPKKVLILTYEGMKREPIAWVKKLADFLGQPFSLEEEREGIAEEIVKLCSFENLSNLEVNKNGVQRFTSTISIDNNVFFRKGDVGDWENHLTREMVERLNQISEQKFKGTGLLSYISP